MVTTRITLYDRQHTLVASYIPTVYQVHRLEFPVRIVSPVFTALASPHLLSMYERNNNDHNCRVSTTTTPNLRLLLLLSLFGFHRSFSLFYTSLCFSCYYRFHQIISVFLSVVYMQIVVYVYRSLSYEYYR